MSPYLIEIRNSQQLEKVNSSMQVERVFRSPNPHYISYCVGSLISQMLPLTLKEIALWHINYLQVYLSQIVYLKQST